MKKVKLFGWMLLVNTMLIGQSGYSKKKIFLNEHWKEVKDSTEAKYCCFNSYYKNKDIDGLSLGVKSRLSLEGQNVYQSQGPVLLSGKYQWKNRKGQVIMEFDFNHGEIISMLHYRSIQGQLVLFEKSDYLDRCGNDQTGYVDQYSCRHTIFDRKGEIKSDGYIRKYRDQYYYVLN